MKIRKIRRAVKKSYPLIGLTGFGLLALDTCTKTGKKIHWCKMKRREINLVEPYVLKERIRRQTAWVKATDPLDEPEFDAFHVQTEKENLVDVRKIERQLVSGEINLRE